MGAHGQAPHLWEPVPSRRQPLLPSGAFSFASYLGPACSDQLHPRRPCGLTFSRGRRAQEDAGRLSQPQEPVEGRASLRGSELPHAPLALSRGLRLQGACGPSEHTTQAACTLGLSLELQCTCRPMTPGCESGLQPLPGLASRPPSPAHRPLGCPCKMAGRLHFLECPVIFNVSAPSLSIKAGHQNSDSWAPRGMTGAPLSNVSWSWAHAQTSSCHKLSPEAGSVPRGS